MYNENPLLSVVIADDLYQWHDDLCHIFLNEDYETVKVVLHKQGATVEVGDGNIACLQEVFTPYSGQRFVLGRDYQKMDDIIEIIFADKFNNYLSSNRRMLEEKATYVWTCKKQVEMISLIEQIFKRHTHNRKYNRSAIVDELTKLSSNDAGTRWMLENFMRAFRERNANAGLFQVS